MSFLKELKKAIRELYGEHPLNNPNYSHIISEKHFDRLTAFLNDGEVVIGGARDKDHLVIEPTVLTGITREDSVIQEEIFGPILPILFP